MGPDQHPDLPPGGAPEEERTEPSGLAPAPPWAPAPLADPLVGRVLDGRYRIIEIVARGGMGRVYRAEQAPLHRVVALKVLEPGSDPEFRDRFIQEAAATARLAHPNTIRIFDYGCTSDGTLYIAMEYLTGRTLQAAIRSEGALEPERALRVVRQICASLREAHQLGMIHRDLKPSNIFLLRTGDEDEFVKVLDFGLVKELARDHDLTRADAVVGSPSYMSPEQIRSGDVDARADIYSVGVLLFACLTGKTPFTGTNSVNLLMAHLQQVPPSLASSRPGLRVPPSLERLVQRCLAKTPDERYATMDELMRALGHCGVQLRADPPTDLIGGPPELSSGGMETIVVLAPDGTSEVSVTTMPRPRTQSRLVPLLGVMVAFVLFSGSLAVAAALFWRWSATAPETIAIPAAPQPVPVAPQLPSPGPPVLESAPSTGTSPPRRSAPGSVIPSPDPPGAAVDDPLLPPDPAAIPAEPEATPDRPGSDLRDPWKDP